jgi:hypothetical protein
MAGNNRFAAGYFFLGLSVGASLALQETAGRRPNGGDIRSRTTGSPQTRRQSPAAIGTPLRHGPDKFADTINYTAEQSATVRSRPARPKVKPIIPNLNIVPGVPFGPGQFREAAVRRQVWGEEITE